MSANKKDWSYTEQQILKNLVHAKPDDLFHYKCSRCADCCKHTKNTVALEALDIFNISRYLKQSGDPNWRIEYILEKYATLIPITDFGYPMFFLETEGIEDACVFLKNGKCGIQHSKPRTCRMYPMTAEPIDDGGSFKYYLITERTHHFSGSLIRAGDWMSINLNTEDREFTKSEFRTIALIGKLMKKKPAVGVDENRILSWILYYKYLNYDVDEPFIPQYVRNNNTLIHVLTEIR